jgi:hypothetical protein
MGRRRSPLMWIPLVRPISAPSRPHQHERQEAEQDGDDGWGGWMAHRCGVPRLPPHPQLRILSFPALRCLIRLRTLNCVSWFFRCPVCLRTLNLESQLFQPQQYCIPSRSRKSRSVPLLFMFQRNRIPSTFAGLSRVYIYSYQKMQKQFKTYDAFARDFCNVRLFRLPFREY